MLSFEKKCFIFESFSELQKKEISNYRVNYEFSNSKVNGKNVGIELHPSVNGYIVGKYLDEATIKKYKPNSRYDISIKNFHEEELKTLIQEVIDAMSKPVESYRSKLASSKITQEIKKPVVENTEVSEGLVRSCLYNWLGYGNLNGAIWFIGTEEGGAEIWRNQTQSIESSLRIRSKFTLTMDFVHVWEELYLVPLNSFKGTSVWTYMACFLFAYEEKIKCFPQRICFY